MKIEVKEDNFFSKFNLFLPKLKQIHYSGNLYLLKNPIVGIVGSRNCSNYGLVTAYNIASTLSKKGVTIISGLAKGIDTAAHKGALEGKGSTISVLGNGLDIYYPKENRDLQEQIKLKGLLVTEYEDGEGARKYHFPVRNGIISALADIIIVVQAGTRSGSLITAEAAIEQGKLVYAVPGNIDSQYNYGCNKLISEGCNILYNLNEIFEILELDQSNKEKSCKNLSNQELEFLELVKNTGEVSIKDISMYLDLNMSKIYEIITNLEMKGVIYSEMGKIGLL